MSSPILNKSAKLIHYRVLRLALDSGTQYRLRHVLSYDRYRNYEDAIRCLNSLQTGYKKLEDNRQMGCISSKWGLKEMNKWIQQIGYSVEELNKLNVIHIAGTKGKGGTCAYVDSILREHHAKTTRPPKVGLYTSPHIKNVRERIQINSEPISEGLFTKYFFQCWDKFAPEGTPDPNGPAYFRFLTLMSYAVFLEEGITVAIYEAGVGGENDSTNIIKNPIVTGITELGIDHQQTLKIPPHLQPTYFVLDSKHSTTIEEIAWHKAGIFKPGSPAFSVPQHANAEMILRRRAKDKGVLLNFVTDSDEFTGVDFPTNIQRKNASLAVALVNTFLAKTTGTLSANYNESSEEVVRALRSARLPGRCQLLKKDLNEWYLDGAHTEDSLAIAGQWYANRTSPSLPRVLIFNHQSQRNGDALLVSLDRALRENDTQIQYAIFCTNRMYLNGKETLDLVNRNISPADENLQDQKRFSALWQKLNPDCETVTVATVEEALRLAKDFGNNGIQALITGSFHLVGAVSVILDA